MRFHRRSGGPKVPPFVNLAFAESLNEDRRERGRTGGEKAQRKARQLCRQAQRALGLALGGECGDELLRDLIVDSVEPMPDASRLLVRLIMPPDGSVAEILQRIERVRGRLRSAVAQAITRKRAPELVFVPAAAGEVRP